MTLSIERESVEQLECSVAAAADPSDFTVEFAFTDVDARPDTWHAGTWVDSSTARTPALGTGSLDLNPGRYQVWLRIQAAGETPVLRVDKLSVR